MKSTNLTSSVIILGAVVFCLSAAPACAADVDPEGEDEAAQNEETETMESAVSDCGPEPHFVAVGDQCLPSCGAAGGSMCLPSGWACYSQVMYDERHWGYVVQVPSVGPTWDCGTCCP